MVFLSLWIMPAGLLSAADDEVPREPIHIEADRMESDQKSETVLFNGNVEARQGELLIRADSMTVYYLKNGSGAETDKAAVKTIDKLTASGNVEIVREGWIAKGDQVDFNARSQEVVLTGNTKVWQGNNMVSGDRIVLYLNEGKSVVEKQGQGEEGRVKAFFYPESESQQTK